MQIDFLSIFISFLNLFVSLIPFFLFLVPVILLILCIKKKVKIKFRTFKGKGFRPERGNFGLYTYCGKQGLMEKVKLIR